MANDQFSEYDFDDDLDLDDEELPEEETVAATNGKRKPRETLTTAQGLYMVAMAIERFTDLMFPPKDPPPAAAPAESDTPEAKAETPVETKAEAAPVKGKK